VVLYVNGVQVASGTTNTNTLNAATTMYIGLGATSGLFLNGSLGVCQAYTVALTASQVLQNYNFLAPRYVEPTPTPTTTSTPTVTPTRTSTPTITPTNTPTSTTTQTPTNTPTITPTQTSTPTVTPTEPFFLLFEDSSIATAENNDNIEIDII
jgi:cytoskeletal protein RodZ